MEQSFGTAIGEWAAFFAAIGGIAATLLGLLFVSVSLRLNLFRDTQVADVRDFAALVFGQYLALVILALLALFPDAHPVGIGLLAMFLGALGLGWGLRVAAEYVRLNRAPGDLNWWSLAIYGASLFAGVAFLATGGALVVGRDAAPLPWLAAGAVGVLAIASVGAWLLLSHAKPG